MTTETIEIKKLTASEGKVITNGEVYGKVIYPAKDTDLSDFYEITDEEYATICAEEESADDMD